MKKTYLIRQVAYHYSDDHYYFHTLGVIHGKSFDDYEEAYAKLLSLERDTYLSIDLNQFSPFAPASAGYLDVQKMFHLKHYFQTVLDLDVWATDLMGVKRDTYLPKHITVEQIESIRNISGLKFFELVSFNHKPKFYGIWQKKPFYSEEGFKTAQGSVFFYNSYWEAFEAETANTPWNVANVTIQGSFSSLSEMPMVLKAMIKNSEQLHYDETTSTLSMPYIHPTVWKSLCTLLKNKPFEIRLLDMETVRKTDQYDFEAM